MTQESIISSKENFQDCLGNILEKRNYKYYNGLKANTIKSSFTSILGKNKNVVTQIYKKEDSIDYVFSKDGINLMEYLLVYVISQKKK